MDTDEWGGKYSTFSPMALSTGVLQLGGGALRQSLSKTARNWGRSKSPPTFLENGGQSKRAGQIIVVKDDDAGKFLDGLPEIGGGARKPGGQFVGRHIVSALADPHGHAFLGAVDAGNADEAEHHGITAPGSVLQKGEFFSRGIRKHGLENKALALADQFLPQRRRDLGGRIRRESQFSGEDVGIDKAQAGGFKVGFVKSGFARAIGAGHGDYHRPLIQGGQGPRR